MHAINLCRAWEVVDDESDALRVRVDLPLEWSAIAWPGGAAPARVRLIRRFGRPSNVGTELALRLVFRGLVGATAMTLNGEPITASEGHGWLTVELAKLQPRNLLAIAVDVERAVGASRPWGDMARLECRERETGALGLPEGSE